MDVAEARRLLGVGADARRDDVRSAYRRLIGAAHPDRSGPSGAPAAAALNEAYAVLTRERRGAPAPTTDPVAGAAPRPPVPAEVLDGDTIHLGVPADEAFARLFEACHRIGTVSYVDRSCGILEAMVRLDGVGTCSLLVTLQGRAHGTDAFCTLEAIERVEQPPVGPVTAALVTALTGR